MSGGTRKYQKIPYCVAVLASLIKGKPVVLYILITLLVRYQPKKKLKGRKMPCNYLSQTFFCPEERYSPIRKVI